MTRPASTASRATEETTKATWAVRRDDEVPSEPEDVLDVDPSSAPLPGPVVDGWVDAVADGSSGRSTSSTRDRTPSLPTQTTSPDGGAVIDSPCGCDGRSNVVTCFHDGYA